jgi:uncharacterized protein YegP (UPF0339 family)
MATATKQGRSTRQRAHRGGAGAPRDFLVVENNGGEYQWVIVANDGATLAQSGAFASFDDAREAASRVRDGAASARLEPPTTSER